MKKVELAMEVIKNKINQAENDKTNLHKRSYSFPSSSSFRRLRNKSLKLLSKETIITEKLVQGKG